MALINTVLSDYTEGDDSAIGGGSRSADSVEEDDDEAIDTDSLPEKVLTSGGNGGGPYHYPPNHPEACGSHGERWRIVDREVVEGFYRPCRWCFGDPYK